MSPRYRLTRRGERVRDAAVTILLGAFLALGAAMIFAWWEVV